MKAVNARYKIRQNYSTCKSKQVQVFLTETAMAISLSIMAVVNMYKYDNRRQHHNNHYNSRIIIITHLIPFDVCHIFEVTGELILKH